MSSEQIEVQERTFSHLDDESEIDMIGHYKTGGGAEKDALFELVLVENGV